MVVSTLPMQSSVEQFERIYQDAAGDASRIPWADGHAKPALINWLNAIAPSIVRCGSRVAVVGCGLGEDAREVIARGYDVTAFDCSPTAIAWCKRIDPENARCYSIADMFNLPARWKHRFDLVVEINTIQAWPPEMHERAMQSIAQLMTPHGHMLVICRCSDEPVTIDDGPPWALTREQLMSCASSAGLVLSDSLAVFMDDEDPPVQRMRGLFKRA